MKLDRTTKIGAIVGSILGLVTSVSVITFLILGLCGVFGLNDDEVKKYHIVFIANDKVLEDEYYAKGQPINTDFTVPSKPDDDLATDYKFVGWDTDGDNLINLIPMRAYKTFTAVALYRGNAIKVTSEETTNVPSIIIEEDNL